MILVFSVSLTLMCCFHTILQQDIMPILIIRDINLHAETDLVVRVH